MDQAPRRASAKRRLKFVLGGVFVALALVSLIGWAMNRQGATPYFLTVSELLEKEIPAADEDYRVNGKVVPGSIERDGLETTFELSDGTATVVVTTDRALPDTFRDDSDVIAKGSFDGRRFTASEVLAKCPSKFKAKA